MKTMKRTSVVRVSEPNVFDYNKLVEDLRHLADKGRKMVILSRHGWHHNHVFLHVDFLKNFNKEQEIKFLGYVLYPHWSDDSCDETGTHPGAGSNWVTLDAPYRVRRSSLPIEEIFLEFKRIPKIRKVKYMLYSR